MKIPGGLAPSRDLNIVARNEMRRMRQNILPAFQAAHMGRKIRS